MRFEVLMIEMRRGQAQGQYFQSTAQIINFVNIPGSERACPETTAWISTHQPFLDETFQGLPYRSAAYSQLFSQGYIRKSLFLTSAHHDDTLPDLFVSVIHNGGHSDAFLSPEQIK